MSVDAKLASLRAVGSRLAAAEGPDDVADVQQQLEGDKQNKDRLALQSFVKECQAAAGGGSRRHGSKKGKRRS